MVLGLRGLILDLNDMILAAALKNTTHSFFSIFKENENTQNSMHTLL